MNEIDTGIRFDEPAANFAIRPTMANSIEDYPCMCDRSKHSIDVKEPRRAFFFLCLYIYLNGKTTHCIFCIFPFCTEAMLFLTYIHFSGRKHALRKTSYLPNHICFASAVCLRRKLTLTAILLVRLTCQFDVIVNPENASETNGTNK